MLNRDDHYSRLGINRDAGVDEIRSAYFDAARRLHPDTNPDPEAVEQFLKIQEAYEVLIDDHKRVVYDSTLSPAGNDTPALSLSIMYSRTGLAYIDEPQLVYALLDLTSIPDPGINTTPPLNLCVVIDKSTSMQGERIDMVKANSSQLLKQLRPQDIISVVAYSDRADVLIPATRVSELEKAQARINSIKTSGGTEIYHGLESGLNQVRRNKSANNISHLILMTDGRTYGDESKCLELARQAAEDGIGVSGLGIGSEWNDLFLDQVASFSGSSTSFITDPDDLKNFLDEKVSTLGKVYAENVTLDFEIDPGAELTYAFRVQPEAAELPLENPIRVGNIAQFHSLRILLEFKVNPITKPDQDIGLLRGYIKMEIPTRSVPTARLRLNLHLPVLIDSEFDAPSQTILLCMSRLTLYRMQEKARKDVQAGNILQATRRLQHLATHLLTQGERELAQTVLYEAESINKTHGFSRNGEKQIKYGTRALLLPPMSEQMNQ